MDILEIHGLRSRTRLGVTNRFLLTMGFPEMGRTSITSTSITDIKEVKI